MRKLKQSKAVATLLIFALSTQAQAQSLAQDHLQNTKTLNRCFLSWFHFADADKRAFMEKRGGDGSPPHVIDFVTYEKPVSLVRPSRVEADIALETKKLYDSYFPPSDASSYVGTWIESGHPYVETKYGPYQWNSHWGSGSGG